MALTSTQIGTIGENLLINGVMKASDGQLAPFQPMADDDGLDVLFYDKVSGNAVAIQLKCRTVTLKKSKSQERGDTVSFEVRKATMKEARQAYLVAALCDPDLTRFEAVWFLAMSDLHKVGKELDDKWRIRPSKAADTKDRYVGYRCVSMKDLVDRIIAVTS